jgi:calcium-dependent protein kinase
MKMLFNEFQILKEIDHPHIVKIYDLLEDQNSYFVVQEIMEGGHLYDKINTLKTFEEADASKIIY